MTNNKNELVELLQCLCPDLCGKGYAYACDMLCPKMIKIYHALITLMLKQVPEPQCGEEHSKHPCKLCRTIMLQNIEKLRVGKDGE